MLEDGWRGARAGGRGTAGSGGYRPRGTCSNVFLIFGLIFCWFSRHRKVQNVCLALVPPSFVENFSCFLVSLTESCMWRGRCLPCWLCGRPPPSHPWPRTPPPPQSPWADPAMRSWGVLHMALCWVHVFLLGGGFGAQGQNYRGGYGPTREREFRNPWDVGAWQG